MSRHRHEPTQCILFWIQLVPVRVHVICRLHVLRRLSGLWRIRGLLRFMGCGDPIPKMVVRRSPALEREISHRLDELGSAPRRVAAPPGSQTRPEGQGATCPCGEPLACRGDSRQLKLTRAGPASSVYAAIGSVARAVENDRDRRRHCACCVDQCWQLSQAAAESG